MPEGDLIPTTAEIPDEIMAKLQSRLAKLQSLYDADTLSPSAFAEKSLTLASEIIHALGLKDKSVCKAGCHYCCIDVPVAISSNEARLIAMHQKIKIKEPARKENDFEYRKSGACRFLKNGMCSIYEVRPLACRSFFSADSVQDCMDGNMHKTFTTGSNQSLLIIQAMLVMNKKRKKAGKALHGEIEEWF